MEIFQGIDWNPSINDIVDDEFVEGERLERDSVMYKILRGTFNDPFADVHEDFKHLVTQQAIEAHGKNEEAPTKSKVTTQKKKTERQTGRDNEEAPKATKFYPGISKLKVKFPRWSSLSTEQQAACIRVLLQCSAPGKPDASKINRDDLETYMSLQSIISEEQTEFLNFAKKHWDSSDLKLIREDLINVKWKFKMKYVNQLPRYYVETGTIPFISNKDINVCFNATALETGKIARMILPKLTRRISIPTNAAKMQNRYFAFKEPFLTKNLISEDVNCEKFLEPHEIDLVISSSGLNCLASNLDSSYKNSWTLPVTVKEFNGKKVVFVDKPLPQLAKNVIQKNTWIYKYILKNYLLHPNHNSSVNLTDDEERKVYIDQDESGESSSEMEGNFSYNIFTIGSCGLPQNELMKNKVERDFKILVRTKTDGVEKMPNKHVQCVILAPKLEHQMSLGAEAVTLEEASRQWAALTFRPDTSLIRIRINPATSDIIQYERRTAMSVNNEIKRLYNVKGEDALQIIYNFIELMTKMTPGKYIVRHTHRNGAFASVYKEANATAKNVVDLQAIYCDEEFQTIPNPPWPLIDKAVPMPMHELFQRMPAMFYPGRKTKLNEPNKKTVRQKGNARKIQKAAAKKRKKEKAQTDEQESGDAETSGSNKAD